MAVKTVTTMRYVDLPSEVRDFVELEGNQAEVLARVNRKVAAGQSLDEIMELVYAETLSISPCDRLGLAFVEEDGARIVARWARAAYEPLLLGPGYAEDLRPSSLAAVIQRGTPRIINDLEAYLEHKPMSASTRLLVQEGVRSSMTCPLMVEGRAIGVFFRSSRRPDAYDERQVRLHQAIAERLSQAVEKAWRIEQLQAAQLAYVEMLAFVSHELKNPLAGIVMDGTLLRDGYAGALNGRQREILGGIVRQAGQLDGLIRDYLDLARLESGTLEAFPRSISFVEDVFEPALETVQPALDEQRARLERAFPPAPVMLDADPELLRIVVVNLLGNAAKYGNPEGLVRVRLEHERGGVRFGVWNTGPGFPAAERPRLFRRFSRLQAPELVRHKGSGVGLYTSWRIIGLHGGSMFAESEEGRWAELGFVIPLSPTRLSPHR